MKEIKINEDTRIAINAGVKVTVTNGAVIFEKEMPRWRANKGEWYFCLETRLCPVEMLEEMSAFDSKNYDAGNYFRTREQAEMAAEKINNLLIKFHEDEDNRLTHR